MMLCGYKSFTIIVRTLGTKIRLTITSVVGFRVKGLELEKVLGLVMYV